MTVDQVQIKSLSVTRLVLGGNPFSGFSHQTPAMDDEMRHYYTAARIKETFRQAESLGINTFLGRADRHITRVLMEYWDEGGQIQWIAQTATEYVPHTRGVADSIRHGAGACYIHGGQMDFWLAQNQVHLIRECISMIHDAGLPAGVAGHTTRVFEWAEENLDLDFYMCAYYNPSHRDTNAEHVIGTVEHFVDQDREDMVRTIAQLSKPAIHYKVFAAGRNDPAQAMDFVARHLRPQDVVCVGVYTRDHPDMLAQDLHLLQQSLAKARK